MTMGHIHSWESMGLVDGPGIRTVIFLQGCRLRCQYCHNPDTWEIDGRAETKTSEEIVAVLNRFKPYYRQYRRRHLLRRGASSSEGLFSRDSGSV